jgi:hypothetical protein
MVITEIKIKIDFHPAKNRGVDIRVHTQGKAMID